MSRGGAWPTRGLGRTAAWLGVMVVLASLLALFSRWMQGSEARALAALEPGRRADVFQTSLASFESLCRGDPGAAFEADCQRQARFLRDFPECGGDCQTQVGRYLRSWGTR